jgi:ligand-binding sensor domain-containing protein/signal transduction histidine kinase
MQSERAADSGRLVAHAPRNGRMCPSVMYRHCYIWLCAISLLGAMRLDAVTQRNLPDGYTRRVWQTQDGLPENTVQAFAQTPDHYLWIGTSGGLVRFDGAKFVVFDRGNTPEIHEDSIFCLAVSHDGSLWAGTDGGSLLRYKDGVFRLYSAEQGLTNGFVRAVYEDRERRLWVGTDEGLFQFTGERFIRIDATANIPGLAVHDIREDHAGRLWVGGSRLVMIQGNECREFLLEGYPSATRVKSILETSDGTVWVGTVSGLQRPRGSLASGRFEKISEVSSTVRVLREDRDGTMWIGSIGGGLVRRRDGHFTRVQTPDNPPGSTVLALFEDSERNIWVGMQTGLLRLSRTAMSTFPLPDVPNADFGTVYADRDGSLWVASTHLYRINAHRDRSELVPAPEPGITVRNVLRDSTGALWVGTDGHGAFRLKGAEKIHYTTHNGLTNDFIRAFLESRDGSVWIATDEGINRWSQGLLTNYRMADGLCYFSIRALLEDSRGGIWIGTDQGVSHWQDGGFLHDAVVERLSSEKVWSIHEDGDGGLWFGTRGGGLFRWRNGVLTLFGSEHGLASNSIFQILEDAHRTFWMSGPNGISSVSRRDLDELADHPGVRPAVTLYGLSDGVEATQMHGGTQPAGVLTPGGELWFPSNRGPVRVLPDQTRPGDLPQVVIEQVFVDGRETSAAGRLVVPPGDGKLQIDYSAIRLRSQERIRFRYKLEGFDREWVEALSGRVAYYTNLPAGEYRFRVQAFEMNMPEKVAEALLPFQWRAHVYRTGWFLALCAVTLLAAVFAAYRLRLRQVHERFEAVLEERNRIAREMHDTVIQGCASTSALLEAVVALENTDFGARGELLESARSQIRGTVDEARQAIWNLRNKEAASPQIGQLLDNMAHQISQISRVPVRFETSGRPVQLDRSVEYVVLMVAREAVYNAVHHAQPQVVSIRVSFEADNMSMQIVDDGCGFDPVEVLAERTANFGLVGMRERVEHAGGRFDVQSAPGRGTQLSVELPVHSVAGRTHPAGARE